VFGKRTLTDKEINMKDEIITKLLLHSECGSQPIESLRPAHPSIKNVSVFLLVLFEVKSEHLLQNE
jgi:hypothetical protein